MSGTKAGRPAKIAPHSGGISPATVTEHQQHHPQCADQPARDADQQHRLAFIVAGFVQDISLTRRVGPFWLGIRFATRKRLGKSRTAFSVAARQAGWQS
jgi:hypothetical protein